MVGNSDSVTVVRSAVCGLLIAGSTTMAQMPEPRMETDAAGVVSLVWESRPGSEYRVETSVDLRNWTEIGGGYGLGGTFAMPVAQIPSDQGGAPVPPPASSAIHVYFVLSPFAANGKTLVSWRDEGVPVLALADLDFSAVLNVPFVVTDITDASGQDYEFTFGLAPRQWNAALETYAGTAHLSPEQAARLALLTDNYAAVRAAMLAATATGTGGAQSASPGGGGPKAWYRIVRTEPDTDGDGVPDYVEWRLGLSPFITDSDFDGYDDGTELAEGSDPNDSSSQPGDPPPTPVPGIDTDGDGLDDDVDFDPLDLNIDWQKTAPVPFIAVEIPSSDFYRPVAVNNRGQVALQYEIDLGAFTLPLWGAIWTPGDPAPLIVSTSAAPLEFVLKDGAGQSETISLTPQSSRITDINDEGVAVGSVRFEGQSSQGSGAIHTVDIAARWPAPAAAPEIVHTGKLAGAGANGGDLALPSEAKRINNAGEIVGTAAFDVGNGQTETVPTHWAVGATNAPGEPQYEASAPPATTAEAGGLSEFDGFGYSVEYYGSAGSAAGIWSEWAAGPTAVWPEIGSRALESAMMPNGRRAVLGSSGLLLRDGSGAAVPAVRPHPGATHLTERGTIFREENGLQVMFHAAEKRLVQAEIGGATQTLTELYDVSSEGVVVGRFTAGANAFILLPIQVETQTYVSQPENRERKKIGIGESVLLQVTSPADAQVEWSVLSPGRGDVSFITQTVGKFDAGELKEKVKICAKLTNYGNATVVTAFEVITPETIFFEKDWDSSGAASNSSDVLFGAYFYFGPDDVSFYNVKGGESAAPPIATGYFDQAPFNGSNHAYWVGGPPNGGNLTRTVIAGKGTKSETSDRIQLGAVPPYSTGHFHWDIKWLYQLPGHPTTSAGIEFTTVRQWCDLTYTPGSPATIKVEGGKGPGNGKEAGSATTGPHTANLP